MAVRTPVEVFSDHVAALSRGDLDGLAADYTDTSVLVTAERVYIGRKDIRGFFEYLLHELPDAEWGLNAEVYHQDVLYIEWTAKSARQTVNDGVDTFLFKDGMIEAQTAKCTLVMSRLNAS